MPRAKKATTHPEANEQLTPQVRRDLVIPGCSTVITCERENGMPIGELLGIVMNLAIANPSATVDFWLKME